MECKRSSGRLANFKKSLGIISVVIFQNTTKSNEVIFYFHNVTKYTHFLLQRIKKTGLPLTRIFCCVGEEAFQGSFKTVTRVKTKD